MKTIAPARFRRMNGPSRRSVANLRRGEPASMGKTDPGYPCGEIHPDILPDEMDVAKPWPPADLSGHSQAKKSSPIQSRGVFGDLRGACSTVSNRLPHPISKLSLLIVPQQFGWGRRSRAGWRTPNHSGHSGSDGQLSSGNLLFQKSAKNLKRQPAIPRSVKNNKFLSII